MEKKAVHEREIESFIRDILKESPFYGELSDEEEHWLVMHIIGHFDVGQMYPYQPHS